MIPNSEKKREFAAFSSVGLLIFFALQYSNITERWNYQIYDSFQKLGNTSSENNIAIITVDDKSLDKIGTWPWSRTIHAELLTRLTDTKPKAIAFDILFTNPDSRYAEGDRIFSAAIRANGRVVLPALHVKTPRGIKLLPPIPILGKSIAQLAHVDAEVDSDGLVRRVFLKAGVGESHLSTLGLASLEVANSIPNTKLPGSIKEFSERSTENKWIRNNQILLSLDNTRHLFETYSYVDVLSNDAILNELTDKIIFVGVTASGLMTSLPIASALENSLISSVYYHASIAHALQTQMGITPVSNIVFYLSSAILVLFLTMIYCLSRAGVTLFATFIFICTITLGSLILLKTALLWLPPATIIMTFIITCTLWNWRQLKLLTKQLSVEKKQAEITLQSIADGVITLDSHKNILYMNPVAQQLTGMSNRSAHNLPIEAVFNVVDSLGGTKISKDLLSYLENKNKNSPHERVTLNSKNGRHYSIRTTIGKMHHSGKEQGTVLAFSDITETLNMLDHMSYQATHDILTDLPNRGLLMERLQHLFVSVKHEKNQVALLFIDIDKFKNVNDGFGHEIGDRLLTKIAIRLKSNIQKQDIVARLGGDEFVIVLNQWASKKSIETVIQKILAGFEQPILVDQRTFYVTCSIGVSLYPQDADDSETLLKNADIAMYSAKDRGGNNAQYFSDNMNKVIQNKLLLEKELRIAVEKNQLKIYYQPQINIHSKKIIGVEALLRWEHNEFGMVSPSQFIPLAEDSGLIIPIGEWVLRSSCAQLNQWKTFVDDEFSLSINVSPRQFLGENVLALLKEVLSKEKINPKQLKLEITEGVFVSEKSDIESTLAAFRKMGGAVSIDDFGTGYSSLSYLNRIPVDQIKIDRSFVTNIEKNSRSCRLTKAIISIAQDMGLNVIAEGVENEEQLNILIEQDCHQIQGYYYSPAIEEDKITELLQVQAVLDEID